MEIDTETLDDFANEMEAAMGYPAWRGFILWAFDEPKMQQQFKVETGRPWLTPPKNGLDRMIDEATGAAAGHAEAFMLWATHAHWGDELLPPKVREAVAAAYPTPTRSPDDEER